MKSSLAVLGVVVVLLAAGCGGGGGSSSSGTSTTQTSGGGGGQGHKKVGLVTDVGRPQRPRLQPPLVRRAPARSERARRTGTRLPGEVDAGVRAEPLHVRTAGLRPDDRRRLHRGDCDRHGRDASSRSRTSRSSTSTRATEPHKPKNVLGLLFREQEIGYLAGYLAGLVEKRQPGKDVIGSVGGQKQPPVDRFIAGYQAGREGGRSGHQDPERLLAGLLRPGEVQADRAEPDRAGRGRHLPGRRRVRSRRARRREGEGRLGDRRRRRPVVPRPAHPHERRQARRHGGVRRDQVGRRRHVQGRPEHRLRPRRTTASALGKISPKVPKSDVAKLNQIRADIISGKIKDIPTEVK